MKKILCTLAVAIIPFLSFSQTPIYDPTRVYDVVTDADTCYLFPLIKPCFNPGVYDWPPCPVMVKQYVATDTVTVYGVAITFKNPLGQVYDTVTLIRALLLDSIESFNIDYYSMRLVDSVSIYRSHPRFCWFLYEDACDKSNCLLTQCYEFYFDTPEQINRMIGTFFVGRYWGLGPNGQGCGMEEYGGEYSTSYPSTVYGNSFGYTSDALNRFYPCTQYYHRKWGVVFPIIGFRCGPIREYWLDSYTGDSAVVRWRNVEQGTLYNLRLVGSDGSDTTFVTSDTLFTLTPLSDSVHYEVMLRKQCHYATSNYDTTVYGQWLSYISFGTAYSDTTGGGGDTIGGGNEGVVQPSGGDFVLAPNPAHGSVQVLLPESAMGGQLALRDLAGRELKAFKIWKTKLDIDVSTLPTGSYMVVLTTPQGIFTRPLLIE